MAIDTAGLGYGVHIITEDGTKYRITKSVTSLSWEEQEGQLAQKATFTVAAEGSVNGEKIPSILKLNRRVYVLANWGEGYKRVFQGMIWEWDYKHAEQKTLTVTAYDPMILLQQSKDHKYFSAGMNTKAIIASICKDAGIEANYKWKQSIKHEKKVFRSNTISDMITELLDEVKQQKNEKYVTIYRDGKLEICGYGTNRDIYKFTGTNTISTQDKMSMSKLVTRVKILGKANDDGRSSVDAVVNGNLDYGVIQEIVTRDSNKNLGEAKQEANTILAERGKPEETIMATAPDLPFLRKGDEVEIKAGSLNGRFYAVSVSHNAVTRQMTMTLMRKP